MSRNTQRGVTLVELMTVVVIITILASVAIPSYRSYLIRTHRADAKTALLTVRAAQEKYYLQYNRYTADLTTTGLGLRPTSENGLYTIAVDLGTADDEDSDQAYTATATPAAGRGQTDDTKCLAMSLTDVGLRSVSGSGGVDYCWR